VRIEGAGHTVQGDNPKALVAELRRFLAAHEVSHGTH
jgi:pimeloyl-ACP methyl ester carboxylesterase